MIQTDTPQPAGRAALHCQELMSRTTSVPDFDVAFERLTRSLAEHASAALARLCNDQTLTVDAVKTGSTGFGEWKEKVGSAHQHSLFSLGDDETGVLTSVSVGELVAQFERLLGGTGEIDDSLTSLPASALRFAQQFEQCIAQSLWRGIDRPGITVIANGDELEQVAPYGADERVWTATFAVSSGQGFQPWKIRFAADEATVSEMVGAPATPVAKGPTIGDRGLNGSAIADVELPLRAVLVDMSMSVARLSSLQTGSLIPVAVNRKVPVLTGEMKIAHGCIGEVDDRVALEISQSFLKGVEA